MGGEAAGHGYIIAESPSAAASLYCRVDLRDGGWRCQHSAAPSLPMSGLGAYHSGNPACSRSARTRLYCQWGATPAKLPTTRHGETEGERGPLPHAGKRKGRGAEPGAGLAHDLARLGTWALAVGDSTSGGRGPQQQVRVGKGSKEDGGAVIPLPSLTTSDSE